MKEKHDSDHNLADLSNINRSSSCEDLDAVEGTDVSDETGNSRFDAETAPSQSLPPNLEDVEINRLSAMASQHGNGLSGTGGDDGAASVETEEAIGEEREHQQQEENHEQSESNIEGWIGGNADASSSSTDTSNISEDKNPPRSSLEQQIERRKHRRRDHEERVAKKKAIMEMTILRSTTLQEDGVSLGDERAIQIEHTASDTAPGDEMAKAMAFPSRLKSTGSEGSGVDEGQGASISANGATYSPGSGITTGNYANRVPSKGDSRDPPPSTDQQHRPLNSQRDETSSAAASEDVEPGAFPVQGRAFGSYPEWGRHGNQNTASPDTTGTCSDERHPAEPRVPNRRSTLEAYALDEQELHDQVRQEILQTTVLAEVVRDEDTRNNKKLIFCGFVGILAVVVLVAGLSIGLIGKNDVENPPGFKSSSSVPSASPTQAPLPTLELLLKVGRIRCGLERSLGFYYNKTASYEGFELDMCRALAAALFGDGNQVVPVVVTNRERFDALKNGSVDVLVRQTTHTMERDVFLGSENGGFSFSVPYLYDGMGFAGRPPYGDCADRLETYFPPCRGLKVCVAESTTHVHVVERLLPASSYVVSHNAIQDFVDGGICNAVAGEKMQISESAMRDLGYVFDYQKGRNFFSKEPLACVTNEDDPTWSSFVNSVVKALFFAEEQGIEMATALKFNKTSMFAGKFPNMFIDAISTVGNYGQMYSRHLQGILPRQEVDKINVNGSTGLLYAHPLGEIHNIGRGRSLGGTLDIIVSRGHLSCGIRLRPGLGDFDSGTQLWSGMDADYCLALAAGIFNETSERIVFVDTTADQDRLKALHTGKVDVVAGINTNLATAAAAFDSTFQQSVAFSQPYFYDPAEGKNSRHRQALALATRQDDSQWVSFVYWIVAATFYAEELLVTQDKHREMQEVHLFGPEHRHMFQHAIRAVGNSREIYNRNMARLQPRAGRNRINRNSAGPQHYPPLFQE